MLTVSGFTIVRNAIRYDYPFRESIRSLLPLVDELVIAVGDSCDGTLEAIRGIASPKIRITQTVWDSNSRRGGAVLAEQTNIALKACQGEWCFYLQADEVLHENDVDRIAHVLKKYRNSQQVDGLSFRYRHFCCDYSIIDPLPYRRQVRIVRNHRGIVSVGDACGFAKAGGLLRTKSTGAWVYHYGYVRPPDTLAMKTCYFESLYNDGHIEPGKEPSVGDFVFNLSRCQNFLGNHPAVMKERIENKPWVAPKLFSKPLWRNWHFYSGLVRKNSRTVRRLYSRYIEKRAS
jgi:glycosyltransferase involved in cell wall biosynthesis